MRSTPFLSLILLTSISAFSLEPLQGTDPLVFEGDLASEMVEGIHRYLDREIKSSVTLREKYWNRDMSSIDAYLVSVEPNRKRLQEILGVNGERLPPEMKTVATLHSSTQVLNIGNSHVMYVEWSVLPGLDGAGWLFRPEKEPLANVIILPDCDEKPELQGGPGWRTAVNLAASGCNVLVPLLIDRDCTFSGNPNIRMTNMPHREFIYRAAFEMGTHVIGLEIQEILAAVDWFDRNHLPTGVIGYGEGGLLAFYAAALDTRIKSAGVSGYFGPRESLWREPIYRNVWSLLKEFGDAEIASLIHPRPLIIESSNHPIIKGPPEIEGLGGAAPGEIITPSTNEVLAEVERARQLTKGLPSHSISMIHPQDGEAWSEDFAQSFMSSLVPSILINQSSPALPSQAELPPLARQHHFEKMVEYTQKLMRDSPNVRARFWTGADRSSVETWKQSTRNLRDHFWEEIIGKLPEPGIPLYPRTRLVYDQPKYRGYEVLLDVYQDVIAYGILLIPKDIEAGERRPVVVCQHGLEGRPQDVADPREDNPFYHRFACNLTEKGYVTFSPQNPYIGGNRFREIQRKANPLKLSLFSFIVRQHQRILEFLSTQPYVDPQRIAFYGLSYGGKTAMRVPALLDGYCLSICSGDFNEWIWKNVSVDSPYSYMFTPEYEMPEFNLGMTFNYSELSGLICPRPFMVERGHDDGVAPDEWVAYEYAKTKRLYDALGIGDLTTIEFFKGPHTIHGVGTFDFLDRHLKWNPQ